MPWQTPTPDRPKLLKTVRAFFVSKGWTANQPERQDPRIDFIAKNRELTYFVTVVDEAQKKFFRLERMIEGMTHDALEIRGQKRQTLTYVLNFHSPLAILETLAERGVSAFSLGELDKLTDTARYLDELPPLLGSREMALLAGNPKVCISISDRFDKSGDRASAIKWARHALTLKNGVSVAHTRLFQMHLDEGDLDSAERVGQEVFYFQPRNSEFLARMEKLAIQRNDPNAASIYRVKRALEEVTPSQPRTFQALIENQRAQQAHLGSNLQTATPSVKVKTATTVVGKFLDKLRRSGGGE